MSALMMLPASLSSQVLKDERKGSAVAFLKAAVAYYASLGVKVERVMTDSGDVILTVLSRRRQPALPPSITTPDALRLKIEPLADCGRYDSIRKVA